MQMILFTTAIKTGYWPRDSNISGHCIKYCGKNTGWKRLQSREQKQVMSSVGRGGGGGGGG